MSEETFHGVTRSKIPWYPTIDSKKCVCCGKCVDYCKHGVYEFEEMDGGQRPVVKNANNCVVYCNGCDEICPSGAIEHPSKVETGKIISKLRKLKTLN
jgi:NAD-dependent dihydropyrimidine dehydrogenase PreA subunit